LQNLKENKNYINCIDIWSLGVTILELCLSCPIWMSYKSKILLNEKYYYTFGYFGCKGREGNKIYQKQIDLSKNLKKILNNSLVYMFDKSNKDMFIDLLGKMLEFNYKKRIIQSLKKITLILLIITITFGLMASIAILVNSINSKVFCRECPFNLGLAHLNAVFGLLL